MLVASYSGSNDVVFGETLFGRNSPVTGITDIIGPIFTTVPTRIKVDRTATVGSFLRQVQQLAAEVIPYQHAGLQHIKRLESDTEMACDFQNLLVIQTSEEEIETGFWDLYGDGVSSNFFTYPLVLECKASVDSTKVEIVAHFDEHTISSWQMQRILYQFDSILRQLNDSSTWEVDKTLNDIELISPQDRLLVREWNKYEPEAIEACVHEKFERLALSQPDAPAVHAWDLHLTYNQLREHAIPLAYHLVSLGVGPEVYVPICMDKSGCAIVCMLAVLLAGGAYVPLDPMAPLSRHQEMILDVTASLILCDPSYSAQYTGVVGNILPVDTHMITKLPQNSQSAYKLRRATSKNAAYIIFTSGSTGRPKGVLMEHGSISTSSVAMRSALLMEPNSRVFQFASYTFDASVVEIWTTLTHGGCVCVPSEDSRIRDLANSMDTMNVTWSLLTPSVANLLDPSSVPSLEVLVCGGEAMSIENVHKWGDKLTLVNGYGPTESAVLAIANSNVSQQKDPSNIGRVLSSLHAWIADSEDHNSLAPVGCVGELLLEGPVLAREYINNSQKTSEVFVKNIPWAAAFDKEHRETCFRRSQSRRMYKTGDLVRYDDSGSIIYIGRKDNQVKRRFPEANLQIPSKEVSLTDRLSVHGQRMELGEIEHSLDRDPEIRHALVALPKLGNFKNRLVAVLSLTQIVATGTTNTACEVIWEGPNAVMTRIGVSKARNRLSEILPAYMLPTSWITVDSLPLLPSGKLDRRAVAHWLENVDQQTYERIMDADEEEDTATAVTNTAIVIQQIFARVLNLPIARVKLTHSFMSLGGDSISAMQVMALCRKENLSFSLSEVLRSKSIHQLASNARFEGELVLQEEKVDQLFDLSPIQQLYFGLKSPKEEKAGDDRFNQSFSLEITRKVNAEVLGRSIERLVSEHSMLRARLVKNPSGTWQQRITSEVKSSYRFRVHEIGCMEDVAAIPLTATKLRHFGLRPQHAGVGTPKS
jgi:amino acid adenylation domain-containing protein